MRVIDYFDKAVMQAPHRTAFIDQYGSHTYTAMREFSNAIAVGMQTRDIRAMASVAVYSPNSSDAFACVLATFRAGGTWVPINARNALEANVDFMILAECEWLFYHSTFAAFIPDIQRQVATLKHLICIDRRDGDNPALSEFIAGNEAVVPDEIPYDPHRQCTILGTGGTTGRSKGIMWDNLTWATLIAEAGIMLPSAIPPVHLCAAPMTHAAGILTFMLTPQAPTNVIVEKIEPLELMQAIEKYSVTHVFLPPSALYAMLSHPRVREFDYSSLTHFLIAASPVAPDKLAEAVELFGPCMCQCYGQVEAPMLITYLPQHDIVAAIDDPALRHRLKSCGKPCSQTRLAIMDADGNILPRGERGEIVVQGNLVAPGYYRDPEATAEARRFDWHHTGDVAYWDDDGYVYIVDRIKDMIITGGFNVFSAEVENTVNGHEAVENCAVIGVPDEKWGEAVTAIVVLRPGKTVSAEEIIQFTKDRIGSVKAPKRVEFWDDMPRSAVGKILKNEIRKVFWGDAERAVN